MIMDHVRASSIIAHSAFRLLCPGGAFVAVTHHYRSPTNRLLGNRLPIIDIENMQLFFNRSVRYLFESAGYVGVTKNALVNTYALRYWMRLAPLPRGVKSAMSSLMAFMGVDNVKLGVNVGNLVAAGFKRT